MLTARSWEALPLWKQTIARSWEVLPLWKQTADAWVCCQPQKNRLDRWVTQAGALPRPPMRPWPGWQMRPAAGDAAPVSDRGQTEAAERDVVRPALLALRTCACRSEHRVRKSAPPQAQAAAGCCNMQQVANWHSPWVQQPRAAAAGEAPAQCTRCRKRPLWCGVAAACQKRGLRGSCRSSLDPRCRRPRQRGRWGRSSGSCPRRHGRARPSPRPAAGARQKNRWEPWRGVQGQPGRNMQDSVGARCSLHDTAGAGSEGASPCRAAVPQIRRPPHLGP